MFTEVTKRKMKVERVSRNVFTKSLAWSLMLNGLLMDQCDSLKGFQYVNIYASNLKNSLVCIKSLGRS